MTETKLGYSQPLEVRIVRKKHRVTFRADKTTISELYEMLAKVPTGSVVDEVITCVGDDEEISSIVFHDEQVER